MKPKTLMLLVVAIGCGLVAAWLTATLGAKQQPQAQEKIKVMAVKKEIPAGQSLKEPADWIEFTEYPKELVQPGAFEFDPKPDAGSEEEQIKKRLASQVVIQTLAPKAQLLKNQLSNKLGIDPRPGWQGIGLKVDAEKVAGGFVQPKARVDVLFTCQMGNGKTFSDTILQNVLVLAVDQQDLRPDEGTKRTPPATVTLELKPDQAKLLNWGRVKGQIALTLRSSSNSTDKEGECEAAGEWEKKIAKANQEDSRGGPGVEMVKVLVAKREITAGTVASRPEELFEQREIPKETVKNSNVLTSFDQVKNRTIYKHLLAGYWVVPKFLENDSKDPVKEKGFTQTIINADTVSVYEDGVLIAQYKLGTQPGAPKSKTPGGEEN